MSLEAITNPDAEMVFFPVRHHSPAAARLVRKWILSRRPAAVLIEGPSDFNDRLDEFLLPHTLPIAIYSYVHLPGGLRRGAYYPFCVYSPEWQAALTGREVGAAVRFIDAPFSAMADDDACPQRYADGELARGNYIQTLCQRLGVDQFDAAWDTLFEIDPQLSLSEYLQRCHHFCQSLRVADQQVSLSNRRREAYMAARIAQARAEFTGPLLVVTGGYHSYALYARLMGEPFVGTNEPATWEGEPPSLDTPLETGIALTPYSYYRLDSLTGYEAGMPNPGFYDQVWHDRTAAPDAGGPTAVSKLLSRVVQRLRARQQRISTADLMALQTMAEGLATLRGHAEVWREDLLDALLSALVKDEREAVREHPLLVAVHEVLRGDARGQLAAGAQSPPLVRDIQALAARYELVAEGPSRELRLDLLAELDCQRSRALHCFRLLNLAGYQFIDGSDPIERTEHACWEVWKLTWTPDLIATSIEASRYGSSVPDATRAKLEERLAAVERSSEEGARLAVDAALAGVTALGQTLFDRLVQLVRGDSDFLSVTGALKQMLYLYRYDEVHGTQGRPEIARLVRETFDRAAWLLGSLGQGVNEKAVLAGLQQLVEVFERCQEILDLAPRQFQELLERVLASAAQAAVTRGGAAGALGTLGAAEPEQLRLALLGFADPAQLGDFLTGLFALGREVVQRYPPLLHSLHDLLKSYTPDEFLVALPALRLAFTYFAPREKQHLVLALRSALGLHAEAAELPTLEVDDQTAATALQWEGRLFAAAERFGLRGGNH